MKLRRRQVKEVALREIKTRGRSRGFRAITAIMLVLAIAAPIAMRFIPNPTAGLRTATIGIGEGSPELLMPTVQTLGADVFSLTFVSLDGMARAEIDQLLRRGEIDVAFEPPNQLAWNQTENSTLGNLISAGLNQVRAIEQARALDLDLDQVVDVFSPTEVGARFVGDSNTTERLRQAVAFFGLFLAFLLPQIFGQLTMLSVVEEKSTRVVEVLLSHIRPATLLLGKILGLCALALVQLSLIMAGLIASLLATKVVEIPSAIWQFVPMLVVSVIGGLAIYTTLFALLGSLISRQEDAAQVMMPVFGPLMVGYFVGQSAVFGDAESIWVKMLTWFPLTSPMLLPVRVARGAIGAGEVVVSVTILALSVWLLIRLASRIYEFTLLRTGSRVGWAELIRLSRGTVTD